MVNTAMKMLEGKAALITGASGGLGGAVTQAFLDAGAKVAGVARHWREKPADENFLALEAELTSADGCRYAVEQTVEKLGRLDVAVHLMGGFAMEGDVQNTRVETLDNMLNMNVRSAFLFFQEAVPHFDGKAGRVLAIGSMAGVHSPAGLSAYSVSKAALHALVLSMAAEGLKHGYTANAILPSTIDTAANRKAMPNADFTAWVKPESIAAQLVLLASDAGADTNGALVAMGGRL